MNAFPVRCRMSYFIPVNGKSFATSRFMDNSFEHEVPMATSKPRRKPTPPARPVTEVLLELAYYLNTSKVIVRPSRNAQHVARMLRAVQPRGM
jgi:hypothetical protein